MGSMRAAPRALPREITVASIRAAFASFANPMPAVLDALAESELLHHDIEELERPVWGRDHTVLIGDAAHAMSPNLGQGASMAIEDAMVVPHVVNAQNPASAIAARRHSRVARIQRTSRFFGEFAHWRSPVAITLQNLLIPSIPQRFGERKYAQLIQARPALDCGD